MKIRLIGYAKDFGKKKPVFECNFVKKVFFLFSTKNLLLILETFLKSENYFSKIINKKSNSDTRI